MLRAALLALPLITPPALAQQITALPTDQLAWDETPEGVAFAPLNGNRFEESYMAMVRLPGGLSSPAHTKSFDMFGVMLEGVMTHVAMDADPAMGAPLGAGAFYRIPANMAHVSSCISDTPCVTFLYQDGVFDFLPVAP